MSYRTRQPSRWLRNLILLTIVAALALLGWNWRGLHEKALVGAAYGARVGCVCRYVSQRPFKSCEGDLKAAGLGRVAGLVSLSDDPATKTVSAGLPLLAHQSAVFSEKTGCQLEPWDE
ncbi:hypothetical protein [Novosphingobium album (ex Hu et al. 2023)]|uniref:Uncharacterized protein n=1 Tax=Novosphingobium album (ex Hu et al. 2023) TaxID=2930093 RepID=A0ABT0B4T9_9SPHN|nr:hypothetical protein [Novosphingobium album (ex Hu et al. 2023)]MCJ2179834.1 hypothetical protein [Novosphingobium album (ex Hu et al. 2023)]